MHPDSVPNKTTGSAGLRRPGTAGTRALVALGFVLACTVLGACDEPTPTKCRILNHVVWPESPLAASPDAKLLKGPAGQSVLWAQSGDTVTFAPVSAAGMLGTEQTMTLPTPRLREPLFVLVGQATAGDTLAAIYVDQAPDSASVFRIMAILQRIGGAPATPQVLERINAATPIESLEWTVGEDSNHNGFLFAYGFPEAASPIVAQRYRGDGTKIGPVVDTKAAAGWSCLHGAQSRKAYAVAWYQPTGVEAVPHNWVTYELSAEASGDSFKFSGTVVTRENPCPPAVTSYPKGYILAYQTRQGTFRMWYELADGMAENQASGDLVASAIGFGTSPENQPPLGGVASVRRDTLLVFARKSGPEVRLYNPKGQSVGDALKLPVESGAIVQTMSSVSAPDLLTTTYRETSGPRHWVQVDCPAE